MNFYRYVLIIICFIYCSAYGQVNNGNKQSWKEGWFEIHHINAKLGNSVFFIFPDGTTLLYDAGQMDYDSMSDQKKAEYCLSTADTLSVAKQIKEYINNFYPSASNGIDYAVISHFHADHYGTITDKSPKSKKGNYQLSGITELYEYLPFRHLFDRGFPDYSYPSDLNDYYDKVDRRPTFQNYRNFVDYLKSNKRTHIESLHVGSNTQIATQKGGKYKFHVRNLKKNNEYWSGNGTENYFLTFSDSPLIKEGRFNENPLSIALLFSYGDFKYYIGGDISGVNDWPDVDIETVLAPVIGKVDVMSLHHHGYKDATNSFFLNTLSPQVIVQQSLHVPHFQTNILTRLVQYGGDVYALHYPSNVPQDIRDIVSRTHKDSNVHVVIRVKPEGKIYFIDTYESNKGRLILKNTFGPYYSSKKQQ